MMLAMISGTPASSALSIASLGAGSTRTPACEQTGRVARAATAALVAAGISSAPRISHARDPVQYALTGLYKLV